MRAVEADPQGGGTYVHIQYMVLCEIAREGLRGTFDILGTFDRVFVPRLPAQHPRVTVVALACADTEDDLGEHDVHLICQLPSGANLFEQHGRIRFQALAGAWLGSNRLVMTIGNMPLPERGRYFFELTVDGVTARHPLDVIEGAPPG